MPGVSTSFLQDLDSARRLPTPPGVVADLLDVTNRADATVKDVARIIASDPAMAAKILRFVNSPMAGVQHEVTSLQQAVSLLGLNSVKMMALSFAIIAPPGSIHCAGFDAFQFAAFSAACGAAARHLSDLLRIGSAQEAYTVGLLSQFGRFIFASTRPEIYEQVIRRARRVPADLPELEQEAFDTTYAEVGAQLLRNWGLPESLCSAISLFRDDPAASDEVPLAGVIALAEEAASVVCPKRINEEATPEYFAGMAQQRFGLSPQACKAALATIAAEARQVCEVLDVPMSKVRSIEDLEAQVRDRITELGIALYLENQALAQQQEDLHRRATTDALTGVGNRAAFDARLDLELERATRSNHAFALLMLDVDHFKDFNDTYGHQAGDRVLKAVARALETNVRKVDYVARYGGEEFSVVVPEVTVDGAAHVAERIRLAVEQCLVPWNGQSLSVTISVGAAIYARDFDSLNAAGLIGDADALLYEAKCAGRNCTRFSINGETVSLAAKTA